MQAEETFMGENASCLGLNIDGASCELYMVDSRGTDVTIMMPVAELAKMRDWINLHVPNTPRERLEVATDFRWPTILQGQAGDPSNSFLSDIVSKGNKYGSLTDKQLAAAFRAAESIVSRGGQKQPEGFEPF